MSCPYDSNYTKDKDTINALFPCSWSCTNWRGKTCTSWGYTCNSTCDQVLEKYIKDPLNNAPSNCLLSNKIPRDCLCGNDKYTLDTSSQCFMQHGEPNITHQSERTITLKNGCKGNNPKMDPPSIDSNSVKCCTGEYTQDPTPSTSKCGIGYCVNGPNCITSMKEYCTDPKSFLGNKIDNQCIKYIEKNKGTGASTVAQSILNTWYPPNELSNIKLYGNKYNQSAIDICNAAPPGTCNTFLTNLCSRFTSRDQLACYGDKECEKVKLLCGCYLPSSLYYDQRESEFVSEECDPICNNKGSVKKVEGGSVQKCDQNLCVFDFENESQWIKSNMNFEQNCSGNAKDGQYSCFVDVKIKSNGTIIDNPTFNQNCKSCAYIDSSNPALPPQEFDCKTGKPKTSIPWVYIVFGILILFIIILLTFVIYRI